MTVNAKIPHNHTQGDMLLLLVRACHIAHKIINGESFYHRKTKDSGSDYSLNNNGNTIPSFVRYSETNVGTSSLSSAIA